MLGYENFEHQHYQEFPEAQGQEQDYGEQSYFGAEIGMEAHIPGLDGRAAQLGNDFQQQVWGPYYGSQFGTTDKTDKPTFPDDMALNLDAPPITRITPTKRPKFNPFLATLSMIQVLVCTLQLGTGLATLAAPRTRTAALSALITILLCTMLFPDSTHALAAPNNTFALCGTDHPSLTATNAFGLSSTTLTNYLVDSGCSTSIITDSTYLTNVRPMLPVQIAGLSGYKILYLRADLHLPVRTAGGEDHVITIHDVFYDPQGHFNLVSTDQLNNSRYDVLLTANPGHRSIHFTNSNHESRYIPIAKVGKLYQIPTLPPIYHDTAALIGQVGSMSLEELYHLCMAHTPLRKLAIMSHQVQGMPRHLQVRENLRLPCDTCQEAKIVKPNAPPASDSISAQEEDLVTWDLINMGEHHPTVSHNRYLSLFMIHRSRYAIVILHQNRKDFKSVLQRAITKMGFTPRVMRSDGAAEYLDADLARFFEERGIQHQISNPHQQFQNALSEKYVDTLVKGIRTLLLQSQLPPEFWGCAAHYFTTVYNHLPHASINHNIPYCVHHQVKPDVSWFRPFGCKTTIYQGKDLIEHGKLAPRGEQGVFIGLA